MSDDVTGTLAAVAAGLPGGGEVRPGQQAMAGAVGRAIADRRHLVVQAGTGTGKSLAYLIPAALSGERVVVATATKALQDQLAHNDLPLVAAAVDRGFSFAVLKGRSNYLCRQRVAEIGGRGEQMTLQPGSADPPDADDPLTAITGGDADAPPTRPRWAGSASRSVASCGGPTTPPPGTGPNSSSSPTSGPGPWSRPPLGSAPGRSGARRAGSASPRPPGLGPPRPTSSWSTPISTGPTWPAGAPCSRPIRWWCSTRPTRWRR